MARMETFVVRVWLPAQASSDREPELVRLHGLVEHVGTGRSSAFQGLDELEALLLSTARRDRRAEGPSASRWSIAGGPASRRGGRTGPGGVP